MSYKFFCLLSAITSTVLISPIYAAAKDSSPPQPVPQKSDAKPVIAENFRSFTGKVVGNKVRLRAQPDLDSKVIRELCKGDLLLITGEKNDFYAVSPPKGTKAYIFRSYILDNVVEASRVNIRLEPNVDAPIVAQLNTGDRVDGIISSANPKWLEIDIPNTARFWVAKDYITSIGDAKLLEKLQTRRNEASQFLEQAYTLSQNELRKPFEEIKIEPVYSSFNRVIQNYSDLPEQVAQAKEGLELVQKSYTEKQVHYLESKTRQTSEAWNVQTMAANETLDRYQQRLADLENQLNQERARANQQSAPVIEQSDATGVYVSSQILSDQMKSWLPVEENYYKLWLQRNPGKTLDDFYQSETPKAIAMVGIIEPYQRSVKNRPGDYVLKVNNQPIAFLYSTKVNLQSYTGQQIKVIAIPRANNHFAYPAYYVIAVD